MGLTRRDVVVRGAMLAAAPRLAFPSADPRLRSLERALRGPLIVPGSAAYESVRQPYNSRFSAVRPLAVAQPLDAQDVRQIVLWAKKTGVRIVARSGGHSYAGYSTAPGVVVDLSRMNRIAVDSAGRATVGAGVRLYALMTALARSGLAIPHGTCPSVGVGGLTLGGGFGLASRAWGLTCDNVVALQIVTADGRVLNCDAKTNADLFWACRGGGGGNFGIVTRFVYRTHRAQPGSWFVATWQWEAVAEVVDAFQRWAPAAPDAMGPLCRLATGPTVQVFGQYLGTEDAMKRVVAGLTAGLPTPKLSTGSASWLDLQLRWAGCLGKAPAECSAFAPTSFAAASAYVDKPMAAGGIAALRRTIEQPGSGAILLDAYGGAVDRVAPSATAFVHRRALYSLQYFASGGAGAKTWVQSTAAAMRPFVSPFAYQNYIDPQLPSWQRAYYGANLARLVQIKRKYDPGNLFRFPQSIRTA